MEQKICASLKQRMVESLTYNSGTSIREWKCSQEHRTRLDLSIVLTQAETLNTRDQNKVTVKLIDKSLQYFRFRMNGKLTSTVQDLQTITGQSFKED